MNCCSLDRAEITSPRALKLLLMDWASCETQETSNINRKSYEMVGLSNGVENQNKLKRTCDKPENSTATEGNGRYIYQIYSKEDDRMRGK